MSYDAECYCADNDGVPCVFCEMETSTRLRLLARNIRDAAIGCESFARGTYNGSYRDDDECDAMMNRYLGLPDPWRPGHALKGKL